MTQAAILALGVGAVWLLLARLARGLRRRQRQRAMWALLVTGVPVLGWLTYACGPLAGLGFLVVGALVLLRLPVQPRARSHS